MSNDIAAPPLLAFRFKVVIQVSGADVPGMSGPLCSASFAECTGLEVTMEPKTLREGGNNYEQVHLPGPVSYGQLTLKRGMTSNFDLWRWFSAVTARGQLGARADAEVRMLDATGAPAATFALDGCLPVKLKAPSLVARDTAIAIEEMSIAYTRFYLRDIGV